MTGREKGPDTGIELGETEGLMGTVKGEKSSRLNFKGKI
jgi:hypothetical protein